MLPKELTVFDYFAAAALSNPAICTGTAPEYELKRWFGSAAGITRAQIMAAQARDAAIEMMKQGGPR